MQRDWTDPRDGLAWLVTLSPSDARGASVSVSFHRPGRMPVWTRQPASPPLDDVDDDDRLMDLLDRARRQGSRDGLRPRPMPGRARLRGERAH